MQNKLSLDKREKSLRVKNSPVENRFNMLCHDHAENNANSFTSYLHNHCTKLTTNFDRTSIVFSLFWQNVLRKKGEESKTHSKVCTCYFLFNFNLIM